ncbi:MAG: efflux RND transporter periplasmic adaptor subunit [Thermoanaerobaculia bacterium]|nr:efflux RND transporter periplasmic adaptor subunit [Thermoanaerobaculia bacterium]
MDSIDLETPEPRRRWPRIALSLGTVALLAGGFYLAQNARTADASETETKKEETKVPIPVDTVAVVAGPVSSYLAATANLVPENEVKVLAEWEGRISRILVEEGQAVQKGQVIAELVRGDSEINLEKSRVRLANAEAGYERTARLHREGLVSPQDLDRASMEKQLSGQELKEAEWRLAKTSIRAPFGGRVTARAIQPGQDIRVGQEIVTVASFEPLVARIYLPERDVLPLRVGQSAKIVSKADESIAFDGVIDQIAPIVDVATGTVKVTVKAGPRPEAVRPGAFVEVRIVQETRAAALLVPREAVVRELQRTFVFVAKDGVAQKRPVVLGLEEGARVEATSGLTAGELVITAGQGGLKDGAPIKLLGAEAS